MLSFVCVCDCSSLVLPLSLVLIFCSRKCWLHFHPLVNSILGSVWVIRLCLGYIISIRLLSELNYNLVVILLAM